MICANCKKKIETPLELYNGSLTCPSCKKSLTTVENFRITEESEELYRLSEGMFFRFLTSKENREKRQEKIEKAVSYCTQAAMAGHPCALVRLGYYYDKGLVESTRSEAERWRIAYGFYTSVCYCDEMKVQLDNEVRKSGKYGDITFRELQETAARYMLDMLLTSYDEFDEIEKFNYEKNRLIVKDRLGIHDTGTRAERKQMDRASRAVRVLRSCLKSKHVPLFGYFRLKKEELISLIEKHEEEKEVFYEFIDKGVEMYQLPCDREGIVDEDPEVSYQALSAKSQIAELIADNVFAANNYLFFCNKSNKHHLLSQADVQKAEKAIKKDSAALVKEIININRAKECVFFDDDIRQFTSGAITPKKCEDALREMLEEMKENE